MSDSQRSPLNLCPDNDEVDTLICTAEECVQSLKFKRVLINETPAFPFRGLNSCVDFDLRNLKNI